MGELERGEGDLEGSGEITCIRLTLRNLIVGNEDKE